MYLREPSARSGWTLAWVLVAGTTCGLVGCDGTNTSSQPLASGQGGAESSTPTSNSSSSGSSDGDSDSAGSEAAGPAGSTNGGQGSDGSGADGSGSANANTTGSGSSNGNGNGSGNGNGNGNTTGSGNGTVTGSGGAGSNGGTNDGTVTTNAGSGGTPSGDPPLVSASENGRYLVDDQGNPFLLVGQASWALATRLQQADATLYLNDQANRGYNTVVVKFIDSAWTDTFPLNAYGELPFSGTLAGGEADWTTPNETYWAQVDWVVEQCAARGMLVIASPIFLGYAPPQGQYEAMIANGLSGTTAYANFLGERYRDHDNILWLVGGDKSAGNTLAGEPLALFVAFTDALKVADPRHMVSGHFLQEQQPYQYSGPWQDYTFLYTGLVTHEAALGGWAFQGPVPMFLGEARYVDAPWDASPPTIRELRGQAWQVMTSGGSGFVFGDEHVWHFDAQNAYADGPWKENLDTAASHHQILIKNLFASRAWHLLEPDTNDSLVTAGRGSRGQLSYVTAARASDGSFAVVYLPNGGGITADLGTLSGPATARWYDPSDGRYVDIDAALTGSREFATPGANSGGDNDWVLLLETAP